MIYKKLMVLSALFCFAFAAVSQNYIDSKTIIETYKADKSTKVDISNKYGKVQIIQWDKDSLRFEIDISAKSSDASRVREMINEIEIDFTQTNYYVAAKTLVDQKSGGILSDLIKIAESVVPTESHTRIDYTVMLPSYVSLKIDNKYGDVFIDDVNADFDLKLSNGDLKANDLKGRTDIELKFCDNASINSIQDGRLTISYSDLIVKSAKDLTVNSKKSNVHIEQINVLKTNSRSDKYHVQNIDFLYGEAYFSDLWIYKLKDELNYDMKYGNLNLEEINKGFEFINIISKFTDLNLFFQRGASYNIDITHKSNNLTYPRDISNLKEQEMEDDRKQFLTYGVIGKNKPTGKVNIKGEESSITILHR